MSKKIFRYSLALTLVLAWAEAVCADSLLPAPRYGVSAQALNWYGADHMIYRGHRYRPRRAERDPMYQRMICRATTAFWQAYLQDDPAARERLAAGGLKGIMRGGARVEQRITGQSLVRHP